MFMWIVKMMLPRSLFDLLLSVGLRQHINQFTRICRHILDLIITRLSDSIIKNEPHVDHFTSDHACVNCDFHSPKPMAPICRITYTKLKSLQSDAFKSDLLATELCTNNLDACNNLAPKELDIAVRAYDKTLTKLIDHHAPLKTKTPENKTIRPLV